MGEKSQPFTIRTDVWQGVRLYPLLFNMMLEKIIREWKGCVDEIRLGIKKEIRVKIKCLGFTENIAIFTNKIKKAQRAVEHLYEIACKSGLQIFYEKTKFQ